MGEKKTTIQPMIVAGIEVPRQRGFDTKQATKILQEITANTSQSHLDLAHAVADYLTTQGVTTAEQVNLLRNALSIRVFRRGSSFTEEDREIVRSIGDVIGIINMPSQLPKEDLGPRETARDLGHGRDRSPKKR